MSYHVCGSESCHEQRILMRTSEKGYQAGEGYKTISKEFGLHKSTVRSIQRSIFNHWSCQSLQVQCERLEICTLK